MHRTLWLIGSGLLTLALLFSCRSREAAAPEAGVPFDLARQRAARLDSVSYTLHFDLPAEKTAAVSARLELQFRLSDAGDPLFLDFAGEEEQLHSVRSGTENIATTVAQQHIRIPARHLKEGVNTLILEFTAGDMSLNRSEDYLYTLLVPDRARTLFPCFDQPDIKARFRLSLSLPESWSAVANGALESKQAAEAGRRVHHFEETLPISTYLFAFAAGDFQSVTRERDGRRMTMYHRETDSSRVALNTEAIFDLHAQAIRWLEEYTSIPLPFDKFDFALIPGFQYGGMEHPGAIFYRQRSLMLDKSATENQQLGRARLIAHETAHMWFGDLVTMEWFNDVWLKEVFANFMAAKAVNPSFPDINHDLSFMLSHRPAAYGEDRSQGSHPIQQELDNLREAGTLYGRIIYQKAPVVMRQLEQIAGEAAFRDGLREYLRTFAFDNATWDDLIAILDRHSKADLASWSEVWVKQAGMPVLRTSLQSSPDEIQSLRLIQEKQAPNGAYWPQQTTVALIYPDSVARFPVDITRAETEVTDAAGYSLPLAILPNASEMSYGYFRLDGQSREYLLENAALLEDPLLRGAAWLALYEAAVRRDLAPEPLLDALQAALLDEEDPLNRQNLTNQLNTLFWRYITPEERLARAAGLEDQLWKRIQESDKVSTKAAYFRTYRNFTLTPEGTESLYAVWSGDESMPELPFSENDRIAMAEALALRLPGRAEEILGTQYTSIKNPDRRQRFAFIRPALSAEQNVRDSFFYSLKEVENRHYEPWVVDAVGLLHHPLRAESSISYIRPSLEWLQEIQATGDIFFPRQWIGATLNGHRSPEAARIVRDFLEEHPDYPPRLRNKILMAADLLLRLQEPLIE